MLAALAIMRSPAAERQAFRPLVAMAFSPVEAAPPELKTPV
jgi:hypothetical protein